MANLYSGLVRIGNEDPDKASRLLKSALDNIRNALQDADVGKGSTSVTTGADAGGEFTTTTRTGTRSDLTPDQIRRLRGG